MTTNAVLNVEPSDTPEMVAILMLCMLFRHGGQITFTMGEIQEIYSQFPSVRFSLSQHGGDVREERITCTLRSLEYTQNDRPTPEAPCG